MKKYANYLCVFVLFSVAVTAASGQQVATYTFENGPWATGGPLVNLLTGLPGSWGDASATGAIATDAGALGNGAVFAGAAFDTGVSLADDSNFTLMGWAKITSGTNFMFGQYSNVGSAANNFYVSAAHSASGYKARLMVNGAGTNTSGVYNDNQWHHYAATYDGTNAKLYVDGVEQINVPTASLNFNENSNLAIGNLSPTPAQQLTTYGSYDEVKIYDSALTAAEILAEFEAKLEINIEQTDGDTEVFEGSYSDSYSISLGSQPTADVVITCTPAASLDLGSGAGVAIDLTFTTANWSTAQTVTVTAVDDSRFDGSRFDAISYSITTTDPSYSLLSIIDTAVSIIDDDITISDGLVAFYKFNKTDVSIDTTVLNSVYGHTGTWGHALARVSIANGIDFGINGVSYSAMEFKNLTTNFSVIDPNESLSSTGDFTLTAWAKVPLAPANKCMLFGQYANTGNTAGNMYLASCDNVTATKNKAKWYLGANCPTLLSEDTYNDDEWHFFAATRSGNAFSLYVDGVLVDSATAAGVELNETDLGIGNLNAVAAQRIPASGAIDEAKIYTTALSAAQILAAYDEYSTMPLVITETGEETKVVEGYSTDNYFVSLAYEPTSDVYVTLSSESLDLGNGAGVDVVLTFTAANWDTAHEVTVTPEYDPVDNGTQMIVISHVIESDDPLYGGRFADDLTVEVVDSFWILERSDLNNDRKVDFEDFAVMAENWLMCTDPTGIDCVLVLP